MHGGYVCTVLCSEITGACLLPLSQKGKLTAVYGRWFKFIGRLYDRLLWVFCSLGIIVIGSFISKKHNYAFPLIRPPMKNRHSTTDFVLDMENRIVSGSVMDKDRVSLFLSIKLSSFIKWLFFALCQWMYYMLHAILNESEWMNNDTTSLRFFINI